MALRRFRGLITADLDRPSGVVTFEVETDNPQLSAQIAKRLLDLLNRFNLETRQSQASAERRFTEVRLAEAKQELLETENRLQAFLEVNRDRGHLATAPLPPGAAGARSQYPASSRERAGPELRAGTDRRSAGHPGHHGGRGAGGPGAAGPANAAVEGDAGPGRRGAPGIPASRSSWPSFGPAGPTRPTSSTSSASSGGPPPATSAAPGGSSGSAGGRPDTYPGAPARPPVRAAPPSTVRTFRTSAPHLLPRPVPSGHGGCTYAISKPSGLFAPEPDFRSVRGRGRGRAGRAVVTLAALMWVREIRVSRSRRPSQRHQDRTTKICTASAAEHSLAPDDTPVAERRDRAFSPGRPHES